MLSVESMGDPILGIDHVDDPGGVQLLTGSEDDDLVQSRHLEQEGVQSETFNSIDPGILSIEDYLNGECGTSDSKSYLAGLVKVV